MEQWEKIGNSDSATAEMSIKEYTAVELWDKAWSMAGKSLFYMQFIHGDMDWSQQQERIHRMCYHLAAEHAAHFEDTVENRKWFHDWMEKFEDEVENQC